MISGLFALIDVWLNDAYIDLPEYKDRIKWRKTLGTGIVFIK
jgi:hypothetical protein